VGQYNALVLQEASLSETVELSSEIVESLQVGTIVRVLEEFDLRHGARGAEKQTLRVRCAHDHAEGWATFATFLVKLPDSFAVPWTGEVYVAYIGAGIAHGAVATIAITGQTTLSVIKTAAMKQLGIEKAIRLHFALCFADGGAQIVGGDTSFLWEVGVCNGTNILIVPLAEDTTTSTLIVPLAGDTATATAFRLRGSSGRGWFLPLMVFVSLFILFEAGLCVIYQISYGTNIQLALPMMVVLFGCFCLCARNAFTIGSSWRDGKAEVGIDHRKTEWTTAIGAVFCAVLAAAEAAWVLAPNAVVELVVEIVIPYLVLAQLWLFSWLWLGGRRVGTGLAMFVVGLLLLVPSLGLSTPLMIAGCVRGRCGCRGEISRAPYGALGDIGTFSKKFSRLALYPYGFAPTHEIRRWRRTPGPEAALRLVVHWRWRRQDWLNSERLFSTSCKRWTSVLGVLALALSCVSTVGLALHQCSAVGKDLATLCCTNSNQNDGKLTHTLGHLW
jgi:hypothetical protein